MGHQVIKFKDPNFKLAIIQQLMYVQKVINPPFDVWDFARTYQERKINVNQEGYETIPEVLDYFLNLEVTEEMAFEITELLQDGGDDIYMNIIPFWDGEDDVFNIKSAEDAGYFPNLKRVILFYDNDESILDDFKNRGIEAEWL
jgi:hypothetical protein